MSQEEEEVLGPELGEEMAQIMKERREQGLRRITFYQAKALAEERLIKRKARQEFLTMMGLSEADLPAR
jgi:hypothetical protein